MIAKARKQPRRAPVTRTREYDWDGCGTMNPRGCRTGGDCAWSIREVVRTDYLDGAAVVRMKRVAAVCTCPDCTEMMLAQIHAEVGTPRFALPGQARGEPKLARISDMEPLRQAKEQRVEEREATHAQSRLATVIRLAGPLPKPKATRDDPDPDTLPIGTNEIDQLANLMQWFECHKPCENRWKEWEDAMMRILERYHVPNADDRQAIEAMRLAGEPVQPIVRSKRHMELWRMWVQKFIEETGQD